MAFERITKLGQIEIFSNGRVQFREESQVFENGKPFGPAEYHRSGIDVGVLSETGELILTPLSAIADQTLGLNTDLDLEKILQGIRTPAIQAAWKAKLLAEREAGEAERKRQEAEKQALLHTKFTEEKRQAYDEADAMRARNNPK